MKDKEIKLWDVFGSDIKTIKRKIKIYNVLNNTSYTIDNVFGLDMLEYKYYSVPYFYGMMFNDEKFDKIKVNKWENKFIEWKKWFENLLNMSSITKYENVKLYMTPKNEFIMIKKDNIIYLNQLIMNNIDSVYDIIGREYILMYIFDTKDYRFESLNQDYYKQKFLD